MPFVSHADVGVDGGNGAATNALDFVKNKLVPFMTSATHFPVAGDRWSLSKPEVVVTPGTDSEFWLTPPANANTCAYMNFRTRPSSIFIFPADGLDLAQIIHDQPGGHRGQPETNLYPETTDRNHCQWVNAMGAGPFLGHYLFAPPGPCRYVHAVIQCAARKWRHIWFGTMDKFATFGGGAYSCAHYWSQAAGSPPQIISQPYHTSHQCCGSPGGGDAAGGWQSASFRADGFRTGMTALSPGNWYWSTNNSDPIGPMPRLSGAGYTNVYGSTATFGLGVIASYDVFGNHMFRMSPSNLSGYQPLIPILFGILVNFEGANRGTIIGQMPDIRRVSMKYFTPAQVITVGADQWQVFPMVNSDTVNTINGQEYSGYEGFAFKRV